jgi:hypothetical protein
MHSILGENGYLQYLSMPFILDIEALINFFDSGIPVVKHKQKAPQSAQSVYTHCMSIGTNYAVLFKTLQ